MKLGRIILALVVSLGLSVGAQARTTSLGSLSDGDVPSFANGFAPNTTFSDTVSFTLASVSDIVGGFFATGVSNFKITFDGGPPLAGVNPGSYSFGTYSFADLAPGSTYTFDITGKTGAIGGAYLSAFAVTAAVPEADTWLMIVVGIGLVAYQLRRKQKALVRRPLAQG